LPFGECHVRLRFKRFSTGTLGEKKANVKLFFFSRYLHFIAVASPAILLQNFIMDTRPVPPASVTVASMLSILASACVAILGLLLAIGASAAPSGNADSLTPHARMILKVVSYSLLGLGGWGIINGVALLGLKNWARKTIVFGSGAAVVVSTFCLYVSLALLGIPSEAKLTDHAQHLLWGSFFGISLLAFGVGLCFAILFTRPATVTSFVAPVAQIPGARSPAPPCPLAMTLLAGFYVLGTVTSLLVQRVPDRAPDMVFGHALYGTARMHYVVITAALMLAAAAGLLWTKNWGIHLAIGLELFRAASHAVTLLSSKSLQSMRDALTAMAAQGVSPPVRDPAIGFHYLETLGLGLALALLLVLFLSRAKFLEAAAASAPQT